MILGMTTNNQGESDESKKRPDSRKKSALVCPKRTDWCRDAHIFIHFGDGLGAITFEAAKRSDYKDQIQKLIRRTGAAMVQYHAKSQNGYTQYPTSHGYTNPALKGLDIIRIWRDATQEMGVKFFAYYNLAGSDAEAAAHPEWTQRKPDGELFSPTPFGLREYDMCFNSPYLEELVLPKVRELIESYHVDGFWFDAGIWSKKLCYCAYCKMFFKEKYGVEPPLEPSQPIWEEWKKFHRDSWNRFSKKLGDYIHSLHQNVIYCVNLEYSPMQPEPPADYVDMLSWDVGGGRRTLQVSFMSRFFDSQDRPFYIMVNEHHRYGLGMPTLPISLEYLEQKHVVVRANGGIPQAWTSTMFNAGISPYYTELNGKVSDFLRERSEVFQDTQPFHEVAILHSATTSYKETNSVWGGGGSKVRGAHLSMIQGHYHCNIVCEEFLARQIDTYGLVIISNQTQLPSYLLESMRNYVREGGSLLVTGLSATSQNVDDNVTMELSDVLGVKPTGRNPLEYGYVWQGFPLPIKSRWYPVELATASVVEPLLKDWNECDKVELPFPAVAVNKFGKGTAVYIASDVFAAYYEQQHPATLRFILEAVKKAYPNQFIDSDAPKRVEFSLRRKGKDLIVHVVNLSVDWDTNESGAIYTEHVPPVGPIKVSVKCKQKPSKVRMVPRFEAPKWSWKANRTSMSIPVIHIHTALVLEDALK